MSTQILVLPRSTLPTDWVSPWPTGDVLDGFQGSLTWMNRADAEMSSQWVQPIACAVLSDRSGRYCVIRRKAQTTRDLRGRLTLVVGGHVDEPAGSSALLEDILEATVARELGEEVGLTGGLHLRPLGVVVDLGSLDASRHVAFVYRIAVSPDDLRLQAPEEFSQRSKYNLSFMPVRELRKLRKRFDPWSGLILDRVLAFDAQEEAPSQMQFPLPSVVRDDTGNKS